jgi:membrane protein DedA with SNARE-associated domain
MPPMEPLTLFVERWGYAAIFAVVVLGNLGVPVPEETILTLAGYLVWRGDLRLGPVLIVAIASASAGDNGSYWLGRRLGSRALNRYKPRLGLNPARLEAGRRFVAKHGALAVFLGRFLPGLRFAVGPLAGIAGIPAPVFLIANVLGACCYVPAVVGVGYAIGRGAGPRLAHVHTTVAAIEFVVAAAAILGTLWALGIRGKRSRRSPQPDPSTIVASVPEVATPSRP